MNSLSLIQERRKRKSTSIDYLNFICMNMFSYDGAEIDDECEDDDFKEEMKGKRSKLDKKTGEGKETDATERAENKKEVLYNIYIYIYISNNICRMTCLKLKRQEKESNSWR